MGSAYLSKFMASPRLVNLGCFPAHGLWPFTKALSLATGVSHKVGVCVGWAYGTLLVLVDQFGVICSQSNPSSSWSDPIMVSRIHIPLICSIPRSGCWSPSCLPSTSYADHDLVFWMGQERNGLLWQCVTQLGKWDTSSHTLPHRRNHWLRRTFLVLS